MKYLLFFSNNLYMYFCRTGYIIVSQSKAITSLTDWLLRALNLENLHIPRCFPSKTFNETNPIPHLTKEVTKVQAIQLGSCVF